MNQSKGLIKKGYKKKREKPGNWLAGWLVRDWLKRGFHREARSSYSASTLYRRASVQCAPREVSKTLNDVIALRPRKLWKGGNAFQSER